jgi:hypothetical protein
MEANVNGPGLAVTYRVQKVPYCKLSVAYKAHALMTDCVTIVTIILGHCREKNLQAA